MRDHLVSIIVFMTVCAILGIAVLLYTVEGLPMILYFAFVVLVGVVCGGVGYWMGDKSYKTSNEFLVDGMKSMSETIKHVAPALGQTAVHQSRQELDQVKIAATIDKLVGERMKQIPAASNGSIGSPMDILSGYEVLD